MEDYPHADLTGRIIKVCFEVHSALGPGFQEIIYHNALKIALQDTGIEFVSERQYRIKFRNKEVGIHRLDLLVENKVVVELKAVENDIPLLFVAQILSYLKATNLQVGLIINFGNNSLEIKRLYNKHYKSSNDLAD